MISQSKISAIVDWLRMIKLIRFDHLPFLQFTLYWHKEPSNENDLEIYFLAFTSYRHRLWRILNRAKKGWIWVISVHFWHFQQLPNSTMSWICRTTATLPNGRRTSFLTSNLILHSWPWKKYVKQYLECIIPFCTTYLNFI